jgi:hypothetical protein
VSIDVSDRAYVRSIIREMRRALHDEPDAPTITTGPMDPMILERVLDAACRASPRIRKHDKFCASGGRR